MKNKESKLNLKTGEMIVLVAIAILNIIWLVCRFATFTGEFKFKTITPILMLIICVIYVLYGYKKPHGNHIRYLLLFYAAHMGSLLVANQGSPFVPAYATVAHVATIILATYMAGRLDRYNQNLIISVAITILQIVYIYPYINLYIQNNSMTFVNFFRIIGPVSLWLTIAASYIVRFKPHKQAGLED